MQAGELGLDSDSDDNSKTEPVGSAIHGRKRKPNDANASTDTTRADAQAETNPGVSEGSAAPKAKSLRLNRLRGWPDLQCADACLFNLNILKRRCSCRAAILREALREGTTVFQVAATRALHNSLSLLITSCRYSIP